MEVVFIDIQGDRVTDVTLPLLKSVTLMEVVFIDIQGDYVTLVTLLANIATPRETLKKNQEKKGKKS